MRRGINILILCALFISYLFAYQNEPDGFRDLKWGTNPDLVKGLVIKKDNPEEGVKAFIRKDDNLSWHGIRLETINYWFYEGALGTVMLEIRNLNSERAKQLEDDLIMEYGDPRKSYFGKGAYKFSWEGKKTRITYFYFTKDHYGDTKEIAYVHFESPEFDRFRFPYAAP